MRRFLAVACTISLGVLCFASNMGLVPSTHLPNPGTEITLQVTGAPTGAQFSWDFNGDGRSDATTTQPWAKWTVPAGYWEVAVDVLQGGKSVARLSTAVVADAHLGAIRSVQWVGGVAEVTVVVRAKQFVVAPGLSETIPPGWVVEVVDDGGAFFQRGNALDALWPTLLDPGMEVRLVYRLYPPTAGAAARLSGMVSGYKDGQRVEARVAGTVTF
ncbi:MAG: hypothetical protein ABID40_00675 [Candidatus Bipolaricaulota bacterium]